MIITLVIVIVIVLGIYTWKKEKFRPWVPYKKYKSSGSRLELYHILRNQPYLAMPSRDKLNRLIDLMDKTKTVLWRVKYYQDGVRYVEYDSDFHTLAFKEGINPLFMTKYEKLILQIIRYRYK